MLLTGVGTMHFFDSSAFESDASKSLLDFLESKLKSLFIRDVFKNPIFIGGLFAAVLKG